MRTLAEQFQFHNSYKTRDSTFLHIGNFQENINLSHIYLAVTSLNSPMQTAEEVVLPLTAGF